MGVVQRIWVRVTEPRHLKLFYLAAYIVTFFTGLVTFVNPPNSIESQLGVFLSLFWALLLTIGGLGGAVCVLPGWWWAERLSVWLAIAGTAIYGGIVLSIQIQAGPGSSRWTQIGFILLATGLLILRLLLTRKWDYEPRPRG